MTKPEAYKFYQYLRKTNQYNKDKKVLFIKASTGVIIDAFTGKKFTYDYDYNDADINTFKIGGHTVITYKYKVNEDTILQFCSYDCYDYYRSLIDVY